MITVMLSGAIAKAPETRVSRNGNSFATATVRVPSDDTELFASITAFGDLSPILAGLQRGDPVTIVGNAKVSTYQSKNGEHRAGLSITASRIIALVDQQAPPRPKAKAVPRVDQREYAPDKDLAF